MRIIRLLLLLLLCSIQVMAQDSTFKVFLIGDAGDDVEPGTALKNLGEELQRNPNSVVLFLGDNCYKDILWGFVHHGYKGFDNSPLTQKRILSQINILNGYKGAVYFLPGNHDWWNRKSVERGKRKLKTEVAFIEENLKKNGLLTNPAPHFLPSGGPGPECVELNNHTISLIFIDTYRLIVTDFKRNNRHHFLPEEIFYHHLDSLIHNAVVKKQKVILAGHNPVYLQGHYNKALKHPHIFARIKTSYIGYPSYTKMAGRLKAILKQYPGIYYASGHLHALEYFFPEDSIHYIISGAGSKEIVISKKEESDNEAAHDFILGQAKGFFEIIFSRSSEAIMVHYQNGQKKLLMIKKQE